MSSSHTIERPRTLPPLPPGNPGDGEGGRGGPNRRRDDISRLGTWILIASIIMLFSGFFSVYIILRFSSQSWPPAGMPPLPKALWWSTVLILVSSGTAHGALHNARLRRLGAYVTWLVATLAIGLGFCVLQTDIWRGMLAVGMAMKHLYATIFYCLTGLHAVHVLGGVIYLISLVVRALFSPRDPMPIRVVGNAMLYWHFVGVLWCFLFVVLYLV